MQSVVDPTHDPFVLGPWQIEPQLRRLNGDGEERRLTPKTMSVLLCLVRAGGNVVTREELLADVWPETHIREEVLTRAISDLRTSLGDDRRDPQFVETIPTVGYRLLVEIAPCEAPDVEPEPAAPNRRRVAVPLAVAALMSVAALLAIAARVTPPAPTDVSQRTEAEGQPAAGPLDAAPLTMLSGFESFAELSPNGKSVAFSHRADGSEDIDLYVIPSAGGSPQRLTAGRPSDAGATWSPDGSRIAFQRYTHEADLAEDGLRCEILEIAATGGPERSLGSCGDNVAADLAWSPSGEWLAFSDRDSDDEPFGIYLLSVIDGSRRKLVAPNGEHWGDSAPAFSPDGRQVAFTRSVSMATQDVLRIAVEGGAAIPVTNDGRSIRGHSWSPEGRAVLVSSQRSGVQGLWRFPISGERPTWLPIATDRAWRPTLGRTSAGPLIFERRELQTGILQHVVEAENTAENTPWLPPMAEDRDPRFSPDGKRVAFASNRSGRFEIWLAHRDGSSPTQLTALDGSFTGSPCWSSDGEFIIFDTRLDGQADVYRVPVAGGPAEQLTTDPANDLAASTLGESIFFGSNRSGRWQIWRLEDDGSTEQVTMEGGYRALPTADGRSLILTRYGSPGLFRHDLENRSTTLIEGTESLAGGSLWTLVGNSLYWLDASADELTLMRQLPNGALEPLGTISSPQRSSSLDVTADGQTVLYAAVQRMESDLWRVEL